MISCFTVKHGIPDLKEAGPILSILEAAAQSDLRATQDVFATADARSLDDAEGAALAAWGEAEDVLRQLPTSASGTVDLGDSSFTQKATTVFGGAAAPIAGTTTLAVVSATNFPATGSVYLGRGTSRYEGPIAYSAKTNVGAYWTLTLSTPTLRFHNQGESVVLAQGGDRVVEAGSLVRVPRSSISDPVDFRTLYRATIPDGETALTGVQVIATTQGAVGNAPAGAVRDFASLPFAGATVTNPLRYNNGFDLEDDDVYRERIRKARKTKTRAVRDALEAAAVGVISPDEGRRVLSASHVPRQGVPSLLVVDDGTGYEERTAGVAVEQILESASGGELDLALQDVPVARAYVASTTAPPYVLSSSAQLVVKVGGTSYTHTFSASAFENIEAATAYEVVAAINADAALGFSARTLEGGSGVAVYAREEEDDDVQVLAPATGTNANTTFGFPAGVVRTLSLYKNDRPLIKDGRVARISSAPFGTWNAMSGSQTLILAVDGTPATTYTFTDSDFINNNTGYLAVGLNSPQAWVTVLQAKLPGVTATTDGTYVYLTSNRGTATGAALAVSGGTLVSNRAFSVDTATGAARDFSLNRSRGLIRLTQAVAASDTISAGTLAPRSFLESTALTTATLASDGHLWVVADGGGSLVTHGVTATTPMGLIGHGVHDHGARLRLEAFPAGSPTTAVFANVRPGDWAVLWDTAVPTTARGAWRVAEVTKVSGLETRLILERRTARSARAGHASVALVPVSTDASRVLVCGGWMAPSSAPTAPVAVTNTVEIYDHTSQTWTAAAPMGTARAYHTATTMNDGRVLVVGGISVNGDALDTAEIYTPSTNTWAAATAYQVATAYHAAIKLADGKVLVMGGRSSATYRNNSAVFNPTGDTWSANTAMGTARAGFQPVLLPDNRVMVAGGETAASTATANAEAFTPGAPGTWAALTAMPTSRRNHGLALVGSTTVIAVGDDRAGSRTGNYTVYNIAGNSWGADTALPSSAVFENKTLVTLHSGNVLALFGRQGSTRWSSEWNASTWTSIAAPGYADSPSRDEVGVVLLYNAAATLLNRVATIGGIDPTRTQPTAAAEVYDKTGNAWSFPDAAVSASFTMSQVGVSIVRTSRWVQDVTIPAASNYTATSFASTITSARGASAETYRTNKVRLRTNSYGPTGSVMLAAANTTAPGLTAAVKTNDISSFGSSESETVLGTPDFTAGRVLEEGLATGTGVASLIRVNRTNITAGSILTVLRNHYDGLTAAPNARWGRNAGFRSTFVGVTPEAQASRLTLRDAAPGGLAPHDRVWTSAPYALGPEDSLSVIVDDDAISNAFSVPLYRKVVPTSGIYGSQVELSEVGGATLATAFGIAFSFDDFAVYMKSRGVVYSGDTNRSMVARYYLHGPAGDLARVRVSYPKAPDAVTAVDVDGTSGANVDIRLRLPAGSARTLADIRGSTRVGTACTSITSGLGTVYHVFNLLVASASRDGSNETTLTLTLPAGITDHGFVVGDILYLRSSDPAWTSGNIVVTARTATTLKFTNTALGTGVVGPNSNIGTVSADPQGEATLTGAGVIAGDFIRVNDLAGIGALFKGETFKIAATTAQYVQSVAVEKTHSSTVTTIAWAALNAASYLQIFAANAPTASTFATNVNLLAAAVNPTCPVTLAVLGTGTGTLTTDTIETLGTSTSWVTLSDGLNHVGRTVLPGTVGTHHQFVLKTAVNSGLVTGAGWASEDVRLVPITPDAVVRWLNAPAVSGLFTLAEVSETQDGERVQIATLRPGSLGSIRVQGGLGNEWSAIVIGPSVDVGSETTVRVSSDGSPGLVAGSWVKAHNTVSGQRLGVFTSSSVLSAWTAAGYMTFSSTTLWTQRFLNSNVRLHVEKQGRYVAISDPAGANANGAVTLAGLVEGDYIELKAAGTPTSFAQMSTPNLGIYRVVRVAPAEGANAGGTVWIENSLAVEETSECNIRGIAYDSVLPGDKLSISHDLWGVGNKGTWTVEAVGVAVDTTSPNFANTTTLKVSIATRAPVAQGAAAALGSLSGSVVVSESTPGHMVRRIRTICPDPTNGAFSLVRLDTATLSRLIGSAQGTVLYPMDKLGFSTARNTGVDGYHVSTGLVGEVSRVIHGDPTDEATYPGVAADGARVEVSGSVVRRIKISILIRTSSGFEVQDLVARVQETVAAVVARGGVGKSIALGAVIRDVQGIQGVEAATILSPTYDALHDVITVAADERPRVMSPSDVSVTFVSD